MLVNLRTSRKCFEKCILAAVRVTRQGPDGLIYVGTDEGHVLRLVSADPVTEN